MNRPCHQLAALPLWAAALTLTPGQGTAGPIGLSVQPATTHVVSGDLFDVNIEITGLDPEDLGAFDLDLGFDPAVIQYQSYSLGIELEDPAFPFGDFSDVSMAGTGIVRLTEAATLIDLSSQSDDFLLATVSFFALAAGNSPLALSVRDLRDDLAGVLTADNVMSGSVTVPLPGTLLLMPFGAGLLLMRRWRAR